jgi:phage shock protein A
MSDYDPVKCLQEEVDRFKRTNRFTAMDVTGFYIQAAVVLDEITRLRAEIEEWRENQNLLRKENHQQAADLAASRADSESLATAVESLLSDVRESPDVIMREHDALFVALAAYRAKHAKP